MYSKRASKEEDPDIPAGWVGLAWCAADDDHRRESTCSPSDLLVYQCTRRDISRQKRGQMASKCSKIWSGGGGDPLEQLVKILARFEFGS